MRPQHSPIECIVPPYVLENIVRNGTSMQRDGAIQTIQVTNQFRSIRTASAAAHEQVMPSSSTVVKKRRIYTAENQSTIPGTLIRQEGEAPTGDPAADEAYDGAGYTYDMYWNVFQRNSVDDQGMALDSTVHYQVGYDNAFWNGVQMIYGDGDNQLPPDQQLFNRFTIAVDVIGHELTHGVTQYTANLTYANQPGALNESISDVFGILVKQRTLNQLAKDADWIIGEGLFTANVKGVGIRSMKAPGTAFDDPVLGKDPQPGHIKDYVSTTQDSGGVHINSGIPNHAFYLVAFELGGFAWEKAGAIWYASLKTKLNSNSSFQDAANQTYAAAGELYGTNSLEQQAVKNGWAGVGIDVQATNGSTGNTKPGCLQGVLKAFGLE